MTSWRSSRQRSRTSTSPGPRPLRPPRRPPPQTSSSEPAPRQSHATGSSGVGKHHLHKQPTSPGEERGCAGAGAGDGLWPRPGPARATPSPYLFLLSPRCERAPRPAPLRVRREAQSWGLLTLLGPSGPQDPRGRASANLLEWEATEQRREKWVQLPGKGKSRAQPSAATAATGVPERGLCSARHRMAAGPLLSPVAPGSRGWAGSPPGLAAPARPGCHVPVASLVWSITPVATLHLCSVLFK